MADKESKSRSRPSATPEDFPTTASSHTIYPSGDFSYSVELVGSIQRELGRLTEAVAGLKERSTTDSEKLDKVRLDIHGAKVAIYVVGVILTILGGSIVWMVNAVIQLLPHSK